MNFHLEYTPKPFATAIRHSDQLLLAGSCFTENIGEKLKQYKFTVLENPNGILFNPASIAASVHAYMDDKRYTAADLFFQNDIWNSWDHHTRYSDVDQQACLDKINASQAGAHTFLKKAGWLLLTLGSAFVYELEAGRVVANCHKVPTDKFNRRLLETEEIISILSALLARLQQFNPALKIIFTISPVRHLREGFVENNRSKARLIESVHRLVEFSPKLFYFPAYELVIDDLRDYRFYAEDMVHPNYAATGYVWEKFISTCIDEDSIQLMKQLNDIRIAFNHKPFNPTSAAHKKFLQSYAAKSKALAEQHAYLDLKEEIKYFGV
jgi:hypothetical protein